VAAFPEGDCEDFVDYSWKSVVIVVVRGKVRGAVGFAADDAQGRMSRPS
jgi:hypothetical protein